ncbi:hypothetical protein [Vagococcus fluvialis]|uniref:hypothetical protein n=1 Tax=Vagococcus fluvialis TaxID=2738 RepID=UPI0037A2BF7C
MENKYRETYQIKLLKDLSMAVYNKLLRFLVNKDLSENEEKQLFLTKILYQFEEIMDINLFDKGLDELKDIEKYWDNMNKFIDEVTKGGDDN